MKKKYLLSFSIALCSILAGAQNAVVTGTVSPEKDGSVMMVFLQDGLLELAATDTVRNGKFSIPLELSSPEARLFYLSCSGYESNLLRYFPIKPGAEVHVDVNSPNIYRWEATSNIPEHAQYGAFADGIKDFMIEFGDQHTQMEAVYADSTLTDEQKADRQKKMNESIDSIQRLALVKKTELLKRLPVSQMWMEELDDAVYTTNYLTAVPESVLPDLKTVYEALSPEWKESSKGKHIRAYLYPPEKVKEGDMMADMDFYDLDGNVKHLADFDGKWRLLDFWSAGCYPCIMAVDELKILAEKYKDTVEVISISRDNDRQWRAASQRHGITWTNWNDLKEETGAHMKYDIEAIPTFILISPDGKIVKKWSGYGVGALKNAICSTALPAPEPVYYHSGDTLIVHNPVVEQNSTEGILELEKIERTPDAAILHFAVFHHPQYWMKIVPESCLRTPDGSQYTVLSADGIELGAEHYVKDWESHITLTFPPLPEGTESFDFIESPSWTITGIRLPKE